MNLVKVKNNIKMIERHPVLIFGNSYKLRIIYKNIKVAQLDIEEDIIKITLQNKYKKISNNEILDFAIQKMYEAIAKVEVERAMEKTRLMLGFAPEDYKIQKINSLSKCIDKNIIINPKIVKYSREIIDYIVLKEYCHLKYKTECKGFFKLLENYCKNYEKFEKLLKV